MTTDQECVFRVGCFRAIYFPVEGGITVESFSIRHNGHPQGDWLVAHEDDHDIPTCAEAIRRAQAYRDFMRGKS